jgi:hypothetical protein
VNLLIKWIFETLGRNKPGQIIASTIIVPIVAVRSVWGNHNWTFVGYTAVWAAVGGFFMASFFVSMEMRTERQRAGRTWIPGIIYWPAMSFGGFIFIVYVATMAFQPHPISSTLDMFSSGQKEIHMRQKGLPH